MELASGIAQYVVSYCVLATTRQTWSWQWFGSAASAVMLPAMCRTCSLQRSTWAHSVEFMVLSYGRL